MAVQGEGTKKEVTVNAGGDLKAQLEHLRQEYEAGRIDVALLVELYRPTAVAVWRTLTRHRRACDQASEPEDGANGGIIPGKET